jgi:hypothetical protein
MEKSLACCGSEGSFEQNAVKKAVVARIPATGSKWSRCGNQISERAGAGKSMIAARWALPHFAAVKGVRCVVKKVL